MLLVYLVCVASTFDVFAVFTSHTHVSLHLLTWVFRIPLRSCVELTVELIDRFRRQNGLHWCGEGDSRTDPVAKLITTSVIRHVLDFCAEPQNRQTGLSWTRWRAVGCFSLTYISYGSIRFIAIGPLLHCKGTIIFYQVHTMCKFCCAASPSLTQCFICKHCIDSK